MVRNFERALAIVHLPLAVLHQWLRAAITALIVILNNNAP